LLLFPMVLAAQAAAGGAVYTRGIGQITATSSKGLDAVTGPVALTAVIMILAAHRTAGRSRLMSWVDWGLIGTFIALTGLTGSRAGPISLLVLLTLAHTHRGGGVRAVVVSLVVMGMFGVGVLEYRTAARGAQSTDSASDILLGDMTVAAFTVGATAAAVPSDMPYQNGRTLGAAALRQLPSPIAIPLFGPAHDTGTWKFREIIGLSNPNFGVGFSLPADGYLNFGRVGVFGICGLLGMLFAWAYPRLDFASGRPLGLFYPVLVASLPFGLRSDALGTTKNLLYAMIVLAVIMVASRASTPGQSSIAVSTPRRQRQPVRA
jgi:hypothetical protein